MATSKTPPIPAPEWWKHLRPFNKRKFWKRVRAAMRVMLRKDP